MAALAKEIEEDKKLREDIHEAKDRDLSTVESKYLFTPTVTNCIVSMEYQLCANLIAYAFRISIYHIVLAKVAEGHSGRAVSAEGGRAADADDIRAETSRPTVFQQNMK